MKFDIALASFRPLAMADVRLLHRWINGDEEVRRWWGRDAGPLSKFEEKYVPRIKGLVPTRGYVIEYASQPIGYIQEYPIDDHPRWAGLVDLNERAAGVDLFVGEPEYRGHGRGSAILRRFLRDVVFGPDDVVSCIIGPDETNLRAIRSTRRPASATSRRSMTRTRRNETFSCASRGRRLWATKRSAVIMMDDPTSSWRLRAR